MKYIYRNRFHLYAVPCNNGVSHLLIKNTYPEPRSIREAIYTEIECAADLQLEKLLSYYIDGFSESTGSPKEIAQMEMSPIGEELYQVKFRNNLLIRLVRGKNNWCVIGTSVSDELFLNEYIENQDEYGNDYSDIVETYVVDYMPSEIYPNISDLDKEFSWCTRYDFEERRWVSPERT